MKTFFARTMAAFVIIGLMIPFAAKAYQQMYVFGDSLSDGGNAYKMIGDAYPGTEFPPHPNDQRNSNGLVSVEYLAKNLGLPLQASTLGGTNFAVSGAMTGQRSSVFNGSLVTTENFADPAYSALDSIFHTSTLRTGTSLLSQVTRFAFNSPSFDPSSTLFIVWAGANDFFFDPEAATIGSAVTNIANSIGVLEAAGARNFLVPGLPDLSLTPGIMEADMALPGTALGFQELSLGFNQALEDTLPNLEVSLGVDITYFDVNAALLGVLADPGALGLTDVTHACLVLDDSGGVSSVCSDPDKSLFWDEVHPTARVAQELGRQFAQAVPEPGTYAMLVLGLVVLAAMGRQAKV